MLRCDAGKDMFPFGDRDTDIRKFRIGTDTLIIRSITGIIEITAGSRIFRHEENENESPVPG
ncbi:MAG: hypothetical protein GDA53_00690 [Rhodobacteraceae bacterium]|nr:hypothetical protein [Paracoccaceae bacterium]